MVHALSEIRRVLVPDGILIDLRPIADEDPVNLSEGMNHARMGNSSE